MPLQGKVCIVTGGSDGMGKAAVYALAAEGATVVVADVDEVRGDGVVRYVNSSGGTAIFVKCDVAVWADAEHVVSVAVESFGGLHVLFNNAGIQLYEGNVLDISLESWRRTFAVNVDGVFNCCRAAVPYMRAAGGGKIINMASPGSFRGWVDNVAYIASKGAVMALTRALAVDHAADNIQVNAIVPGLVLTAMGERFLQRQDDPSILTDAVVGGAGHPDDVAPLVVFLAGDGSRFCTGAPFIVDGGRLAI